MASVHMAIVHFRLRAGISPERATDELRATVPLYQAEPALVRKMISLDVEAGRGTSVYLWRDRGAAERFFERARPILREQTGAEPQITIMPVSMIVDNEAGGVAEPA